MTQKKEQQQRQHKQIKISFRMEPEEHGDLKTQADVAALSISEYIRRRLSGRQVKSKLDLRVLAELRKLGGLLKHIHNETCGAYSNKTSEAIQALTAYARELERELNKSDSQNPA